MNSNKIDKLNKFSTFKNIKFKHNTYGIIKSGIYKGLQIEIREFIPEKIEVRINNKVILTTRDNLRGKKYNILNIVPSRVSGLLSDFRSVVLNADNIFYRDVLLKKLSSEDTNHYASVKKIIQKGLNKDYYIKGEIFKNKRYIEIEFKYSDILEKMDNFKINESYEEDNKKEEVEYVYDMDVDTEDFGEFSDTEDTEDFGEFSDTDNLDESEDGLNNDDIFTDDVDIMRPSIAYKKRTNIMEDKKITKEDHIVLKYIEHIFLSILNKGKITSKLFSKKDDRIDELDKMNMVSESSILNIVEKINDTRRKMNDKLKGIKKSITVNSIDDMFIISGVVFLNLRNILDYKNYMEYLIKSEYFGKNTNANLKMSILLKNTGLFGCEVNKKDIDINKIIMNTGTCFIKIIESYTENMPLSIKLRGISLPSDVEFIKLKEKSKEEKEKSKDIQKPILSIKDQLIYRRETTKDNNKRMLYNYLIENINNIEDEIEKLHKTVVNILSNIFKEDFKGQYDLCSDKGCRENLISKYINMTFDTIQKNGLIDLSESDNVILQKYMELNKIRILQNREKLVVKMEAPDYKKGELDRERVKRFVNKIKRKPSSSKSSSVSKKKKMDKVKIDNTDMIRYLLKDIDLNKI